jgi:O-antigen ligase
MELVLFTLLLGGFGYLVYKNLAWAIYVVLLLLPAYTFRVSIFGLPTTLLEGMILVLFGVWIYRNQHTVFLTQSYTGIPQWIEDNKFLSGSLFLLILGSLFGIAVAPSWLGAIGLWRAYFLEPVLFLIVCIDTIQKEKDFKIALHGLLGSGVLVSVYAIAQKVFGFGGITEMLGAVENHRATSIYPYPNAVGLYVSPLIMIAYYYSLQCFRENDYKQVGAYVLAGLAMVGGIISSESEAGLLAVIAVAGVYTIYEYRKYWYAWLVAAGSGALVLYFGLPTIWHKILDKVLLNDFSGTIRRHMYAESVQMLAMHPVFGAGLGGFQEALLPFHQSIIWIGKTLQPVEIYLYPHNIFLNFYSEIGLFGLMGFISLAGMYVHQAYKNRMSWLVQVSILMMGVIFVHGLVDVPFFKNDLAVLFVLVLSIPFFAKMNKREHAS